MVLHILHKSCDKSIMHSFALNLVYRDFSNDCYYFQTGCKNKTHFNDKNVKEQKGHIKVMENPSLQSILRKTSK